MAKRILLLVMAGAALGTGAAYAGMTRDVYTDGARITDARSPYTDGGKAGKFDVYTEGAWRGDTRYPSTEGSPS
ncbi:hypothetical protein [Ralstonia sp. SET104]|uniref:hypothetical protein n=1 Tax=Ralstonia sp. SET104 TaxID=2448774 RepID=UPI000F565BED|nr:hypothetical protein [Ralstonia sp. SET104]GCB05253.1 hypothetical protein PSUB009319_28840 [Ralstonia sp. SET104]